MGQPGLSQRYNGTRGCLSGTERQPLEPGVHHERLEFDTKEEAVAYAQRAGIAYRVEEPRPAASRKGLSYSDNFKFNRTAPWTH